MLRAVWGLVLGAALALACAESPPSPVGSSTSVAEGGHPALDGSPAHADAGVSEAANDGGPPAVGIQVPTADGPFSTDDLPLSSDWDASLAEGCPVGTTDAKIVTGSDEYLLERTADDLEHGAALVACKAATRWNYSACDTERNVCLQVGSTELAEKTTYYAQVSGIDGIWYARLNASDLGTTSWCRGADGAWLAWVDVDWSGTMTNTGGDTVAVRLTIHGPLDAQVCVAGQ